MKRSILIILCFCALFGQAQDYFPFINDRTYQYAVDNSIFPIRIAEYGSTKYEKYYYFSWQRNASTAVLEPCTYGSPNPICKRMYIDQYSDFIHFELSNGDTAFFLKNITLGASWTLSKTKNVQATVARKKYFQTQFIQDTVYVIELSTQDSILLGKKYGLIQTPLFENLAVHATLQLLKEETPQNFIYYDYSGIYNFSVGDVFAYRYSEYKYHLGGPHFMVMVTDIDKKRYYTKEIVQKWETKDSLYYRVVKDGVSAVEGYTRFLNTNAEMWMKCGFNGIKPSNRFSDVLEFYETVSGVTNYFSPGLGMTLRDNSIYLGSSGGWERKDELVGYKRSGVIHGEVPLSIEEDYKKNKICLFPNPAFDHVLIKSANLEKVELYSPNGETKVEQVTNVGASTYRISLEGYVQGIYIVKCFYTDGTTSTSKLIKGN